MDLACSCHIFSPGTCWGEQCCLLLSLLQWFMQPSPGMSVFPSALPSNARWHSQRDHLVLITEPWKATDSPSQLRFAPSPKTWTNQLSMMLHFLWMQDSKDSCLSASACCPRAVMVRTRQWELQVTRWHLCLLPSDPSSHLGVPSCSPTCRVAPWGRNKTRPTCRLHSKAWPCGSLTFFYKGFISFLGKRRKACSGTILILLYEPDAGFRNAKDNNWIILFLEKKFLWDNGYSE